MSIDEDFAEFVAARWSSLYRLAYLLAASPTGAEDLLQTTLEKAYVNWYRIGRMEYAEAYVRRMLANTLVSSRRRAWHRERPTDALPEAVRGLRRAAGPRPLAPLAAGVRAPGPAAGGDRAALLRGPERGADRRRPRLRAGHREVPVVGRDRGAASSRGRGGRRRGGGGVMNLDDQLRAALSQEADMQYATRTRRGPADHRRPGRVGAAATWSGPAAPLSRSCSSAGARTPSLQDRPATLASSRSWTPTRRDPAASCPRTLAPRRSSPGTYRVLVGASADGAAIEADLTFEARAGTPGTSPCSTRDATAGSASTARCARGGVRLHRRRLDDRTSDDPGGARATARRAAGEHGRPARRVDGDAGSRRPAPPGADPPGVPDQRGLPRGRDATRQPRHQLRLRLAPAGRRDGLLGHGGGRRRRRGRRVARGRLRRRCWSTRSPRPPSRSPSSGPSPPVAVNGLSTALG